MGPIITPHSEKSQEAVRQLMADLAAKRGCPVLVVYQNQGMFELLAEPLTTSLIQTIRSNASEIEEHGKISVQIDSAGGDIEDVFRLLRAIRQSADRVEAIVSSWAKSAATFFCLGADVIYMGPDAELGPLDPQIQDPKGGARRRSPLETFHALEQLRTYSLEALDSIVQLLMRRTHMDVPYAIEQAMPLLSAIVTPLYNQVDPHELGEMGRHLSVSEEYAKLVMGRWGYSDLDEDELADIVVRLVREFPTHGFVIDREEAERIGLRVQPLDDDSENLCKQLMGQVEGCVGLWIPPKQPGVGLDSVAGDMVESEGRHGPTQDGSTQAPDNGRKSIAEPTANKEGVDGDTTDS